MKKIVIIAALSHPEYKEKIKRKKKITKPFWDCAVLRNNKPVDIIDFYKSKNPNINTYDRHIYNNGIVLHNFFHDKKYNVHLINTFIDTSKEDIKKISECDYVIFSTGYPGYGNRLESIIKTTKKVKKINPQAKIIIGGWEIYRALKDRHNPYYEPFLKKLYQAGANLIIGSRQGLNIALKNIKKTPHFQGIIYDQRDYPPVNPKLYNISNLPEKFHSAHTAITTTDGCPFNCNFCSYKLLHEKVNRLPIKDIRQILINLNKNRSQPLRHIRFADECFNYPYQRIIKICQMINSLKFNFNWSCFIRAGNINKKMVQIMKKSGCNLVSIGIESGDYNMRKRMNKIITDKEISKTIDLFKKSGIKTTISLILGYYGENKKTISATKKMLEQNKPDIARINIWFPLQNEHKMENAKRFSLEWTKNGWNHSTMNEKQAFQMAAWLYRNTKGIAFSPPFISVFDLWPWFQGQGLNKKEILQIIKEYYLTSLKT